MNRWNKTLDLTPVWQGGDVPESEVHTVGKYIASRLKSLYPDYLNEDKWGYDLDDMILGFDNILTLEEYEESPEDYSFCSPYDEFNGWMNTLYDFADANNLWVKTRG